MKLYFDFLSHRTGAFLITLGVAIIACTLSARVQAADEQTFSSPDAAVKALVAAATNDDTNGMHAIFGPVGHQLMSPDAVQRTNEYRVFVQRLTEKTQLNTNSDSSLTLWLGADALAVSDTAGETTGRPVSGIDTAAGEREILNRRIGMDELGAIAVCHSYVDAQREYASQRSHGRRRAGVREIPPQHPRHTRRVIPSGPPTTASH